MMTKNLRYGALVAAFIGMGMSMPGCPDQKAIQSQIDALQASSAELKTRVQALDQQMSGITNASNQTQELLTQMNGVIQAQKQAMDTLAAKVEAMHRAPAPAAAAKKAAPAKRRR